MRHFCKIPLFCKNADYVQSATNYHIRKFKIFHFFIFVQINHLKTKFQSTQ